MSEDIDSIVARLARSDRQALRALYAATAAKVYGAVLTLLRDEREAQSVLREAYRDAWRARRERAGVGSGHLVWLQALARRHALERLFAGGARRAGGGGGANLSTQPPALDGLDRVAEADRILLTTAYVEGLSLEDLARRFDTTPDRAAERLYTAITAMRGGGG